MKQLRFESRDEWLAYRRGKITGSTLKDIVVKRGTGKKLGSYELIAARLGLPADDENAMLRGQRLEPEALAMFTEKTGKKLDTSLIIWERDDDESIAVSPDGVVAGEIEAVETKCLGSAKHIEAWVTQKIPDDFQFQKLQYFIVNEQLEILYFVFYDPRLIAMPYFVIEVKREDVEKEVAEYLEYQRKELEWVNEIVNKLTF